MEFFHILRDFMSQFKNRVILLVLGYGLGGCAAYYFWKLTLLISDGSNQNFIYKVWQFYWSTDHHGYFFGFLVMFFIGWILALIAIFFEFIFLIMEWNENHLWSNILRAIISIGLLFGILYFFMKSLLILIAVITAAIIIYFILSIILDSR
ncbi:hypothetical protein JCM39194_17540 [Desulfotomaculum varum]